MELSGSHLDFPRGVRRSMVAHLLTPRKFDARGSSALFSSAGGECRVGALCSEAAADPSLPQAAALPKFVAFGRPFPEIRPHYPTLWCRSLKSDLPRLLAPLCFRISSKGHFGVTLAAHCPTVSARIASSLARSASFARTLTRCRFAMSCTSAHERRRDPAKSNSARISSRLKPKSRARRMNPSVLLWLWL